MTVRGIICVVLEALLLVLGLGTGYRALLMAAFCLGLVLLVAGVSLLSAVLFTRAEGTLSCGECYRGDTVAYTVTVTGVVLLPVAGYLGILPPGKEKGERDFLSRHSFLLMPAFRWRRQVTLDLPCPHHGYWMAGPQAMRYEDLFGLFRVGLVGAAKRRLIRHLTVLPHIYDLSANPVSASEAAGFADSQLRSTESGELLGDARLYQPGDPLKRIHWKLSARTRELHTRQFELQENAQVLLLLDMFCRSKQRQATADIAVETALTLLRFYLENEMPVRLLPVRNPATSPLQECRVSDQGNLTEVQTRLLSYRFATAAQPLEVWQLQDVGFSSAGTVLVITDNPSVQLLRDLDSLAATGRRVYCFAPRVSVPSADLTGATTQPVELGRPEDIPEKVGGCV